jgi:glycosyltransferase involved in cell wall biosynthesis
MGIRSGPELVALLNAHKIIVIPSRWQEPFGLVALEGIACGCVAVAADAGGLPDAVGTAGVLFPSGKTDALAQCLENLLQDEGLTARCRAAAHDHLLNHDAATVARKYLKVLEGALR